MNDEYDRFLHSPHTVVSNRAALLGAVRSAMRADDPEERLADLVEHAWRASERRTRSLLGQVQPADGRASTWWH